MALRNIELAKINPAEAVRIALCNEKSKLFDFENKSLEKHSKELLFDRDKHLFMPLSGTRAR